MGIGFFIWGIWAFFIFVFIFIKNKSLKTKVNFLLAEIEQKSILKIAQTNCSSKTFGPRNKNLLIRQCSLYALEDFVLIIGKPKCNALNLQFKPIILTKNISELYAQFPFAIIDTIDNVWVNTKEQLTIRFGTAIRTQVEICFKDLTPSQVELLKNWI